MKTVEDCTFIAMQYVEGEDLAARLRRGPLPVAEALRLAVQVADALAEAHARGIVHRDVKPHNIMITLRGQAKLLDFGLAQLRRTEPDPLETNHDSEAVTASRITQPGSVVGTPAYMSPEQLRAIDLDARTDIFSLAVVLYEMLAGCRPFVGTSQADTMAAILTAGIPPLARTTPGLPADLDRILTKALAKDRDDRYQTAADLLVDLRTVLRAVDSGITSAPILTASVALPVNAIAVLPFLDLSATKDQQYLCDGMAEEVINALARIPGLRVACRSSAFHFRGQEQDIREIGARLRVGAVLEAGVRRAGNRLRVTPRLTSVQDGFTLWADRFDGEIRDVFDIQDEISRAIVDALKLHLSGERVEVTPSHPAHREHGGLPALPEGPLPLEPPPAPGHPHRPRVLPEGTGRGPGIRARLRGNGRLLHRPRLLRGRGPRNGHPPRPRRRGEGPPDRRQQLGSPRHARE